MTENITQMRERHSKEIAVLQANCLHNGARQWMPYSYSGFDHLNGDICLICLTCGKELDREKLPIKWLHCEPVIENADGTWFIPLSRFEQYIKEKNEALHEQANDK